MKPFLEEIANRLIRKFPTGMDKIAVVLPSKRAVVFLKNYLSKKISKPIFLPQFFSIEEFIESISDLKVIDNVSLQFYLYSSYLSITDSKKETFNEFLNWGNTLLQDFNDIDTNMVDAKSLFTNIKNVKELENWNLEQWSFSNDNLTQKQREYIDFFSSLYLVYENYKNLLLENKYAYQGLANLVAAQKINNSNINWNRVWFVGLNALTKSQHLIIDNLKQRNIARVFWDADKYYMQNNDHEASFFLKQQKNKWSEIDFEGIGDYLSHKKDKFQVISCPQDIAQAQVVSMLLSETSKDDLVDSNTAIILADEGLLYPVLNNIPKNVNRLNVTMGSPFQNTPFYTFVRSYLDLIKNSVKTKNEGFYYKDFINLIDNPFFKKISSSTEIFSAKNEIITNNIIFINEHYLSNIFSNRNFKNIFNINDNAVTVIDQLKSLVSLLLIQSIKNKNYLDSEIIYVFNKSLEIVVRLVEKFSFKLDVSTLITLIDRVISKEVIPFKGEPLEGVQLMGILESRALDFKNVIILGVNEGILPKGKIINSLIPYELKKYYKIPTYSERDAIFSYHFYRILQRAKNVTLTYNSSMKDFGVGEKSRFVTQLISEYKANKIKELVFYDQPEIQDQNNDLLIKNKDIKNQIISWGNQGVSPTALNTYKNSSLEFYLHYLIKIREPKEIDEFADNGIMGSAIHYVLEHFYSNEIISSDIFLNFEKKIKPLVLEFYQKILSAQTYKTGKNYLSLKVAERLISDCLKYEENLIKKGNKIQILFREAELEYNFIIDGYSFKLTGNIDRIDLFNNALRIIDYKSGNISRKNELIFSDWNDIVDDAKNDKIFQLLMYTYLFLKNYPEYLNRDIQVGIYFLRNIRNGFVPLQKKGGLIFNNDFINDFEKQLTRLFNRIVQNDFSQNENDRLIEYSTCLKILN